MPPKREQELLSVSEKLMAMSEQQMARLESSFPHVAELASLDFCEQVIFCLERRHYKTLEFLVSSRIHDSYSIYSEMENPPVLIAKWLEAIKVKAKSSRMLKRALNSKTKYEVDEE
jgi:hypothetical protein